MAHDRANAFLWLDSDAFAVWIDYDAGTGRALSATVQNDGASGVFAEVAAIRKVSGQNVFGHAFPPGTTTLAIPAQANLRVGFDANDDDAPYLTGLASLAFRSAG